MQYIARGCLYNFDIQFPEMLRAFVGNCSIGRMGRMEVALNKGWTFCKEGGAPSQIDLPHDAMLGETRDASCRNGVNAGYFPGGKYIYEKRFSLDAAVIGKSIVLHFEGVYRNCKVYINGEPGVYVSVTKQSGENSVTVANSVYAKMESLKDVLPSDIKMEIVRDDTDSILDVYEVPILNTRT